MGSPLAVPDRRPARVPPPIPQPAPRPDAGPRQSAVRALGNRDVTQTLGQFNDFADLVNDFQELAAAALNRHGQGLRTYRLGRHLSGPHRNLLEDVRTVLIDGQATSSVEARQSAAADWRRVSARLRSSLDQARLVGIRGGVIAAVADDLALIGETYLHARVTGPSELESGEDYADTLIAVRDLLTVFDRAGEGSLGLLRESVRGRPDAAVSTATQEVNARQRTKLQAVKLGPHLLERHRAAVEKLRQAMLLARSEAPGAAYKALLLWNSTKNELAHVMLRAPAFVSGDVADLARGLDTFGGLLAKHYELVHAETLATALTARPTPGEAATDRVLAQVGAEQAREKLRESRMLDQFRYALTIIEQGLARVPDRPGEWLLTSGPVRIRIRDDQAAQLRAVAAAQLKDYMAHLVTEMVAAAENYDSIKRGNSSFKLHLLGGWGGASDPGSQDHFRANVIGVRDTIVFPMVDRGEFLKAFAMIMAQKGVVERQAKEVADYDTDLDVGYSRLARSMQVLEIALTALVPVAGEMALVKGGYGILTVGGTATAVGTAAPVIVEGAREIVSGEGLDAGKLLHTGRHGLTISAGAVAPAATRALGSVFGAGQPAVAGMLAGDVAKAGVTDLIADTAATGVVGGTQSVMGGGSFGEGFVGSSVAGLGMHGAKGVGLTGPVGSTLGAAGAGSFGAWASGGDPIAGAFGGVGHVGGAVSNVGGLLTGKPSGVQDGAPVPVGPEGDATYHGPVPGAVPVPVGPEGDATYHGPAPIAAEQLARDPGAGIATPRAPGSLGAMARLSPDVHRAQAALHARLEALLDRLATAQHRFAAIFESGERGRVLQQRAERLAIRVQEYDVQLTAGRERYLDVLRGRATGPLEPALNEETARAVSWLEPRIRALDAQVARLENLTEPVPWPTATERERVDEYVAKAALLREAVAAAEARLDPAVLDEGGVALAAALRADPAVQGIATEMRGLALAAHAGRVETPFLVEHIEELVRQQRVLTSGGTRATQFGRRGTCAAALVAPDGLAGRTLDQIDQVLTAAGAVRRPAEGGLVEGATPSGSPARGMVAWTFKRDGSTVRLDVPGDLEPGLRRPFASGTEPHLSREDASGVHYDESGVAVPAGSTPAHIPVADQLRAARTWVRDRR